MIGKKINQLATELAPVSTDLTIIGDPISGVSKKITLAQLGAIFSGAVSFYDDLASFPATGDINVIYCAKDTKKLYLWSGSAYVEVFPSQALLDTYQLRSEKGVSNGYASLDSGGKVPISQLPSSIMEYKGMWNAATNTPTLANGTGDTGDVYICNVAGTVNFGAGPITFAVGDYVIYSGTIWQRSSGAVGTVTSVAATITGDAIGITGSPVTTSGTLALAFGGTNLQYINGAGNLTTFPTLTGFVPYTGATANVDLGTFDLTADILTAATGSYTSSGGGNTLEISHTSGSGIGINITKGGNGEGLYINKTSGTGNAATIIGTLNATTLVKSGGTSTQFLKADGSVDTNTYLTTSAASSTYLPLILNSSANTVDINGQQFTIQGSAGGFTSGRIIVDPVFSALGYQNAGVFNGLKILTNGSAEFSNSGITRFFNQVRFDSTLSNGTHTYTLPSATGTLALTSDLTGGTVTSVGLSSATSGVTIGSSPITTSGTITLAIATASGSQQGLLSSTDWTTFNNKQNALTNPVTGTGTTNYLPKFTGASTIGNSQIIDSTNVLINRTSSFNAGTLTGQKLQITGGIGINTDAGDGVARLTLIGNSNTGDGTIDWGGNGNFNLVFSNNGNTRMTLNASGNLGLGVTPSAWDAGHRAFQFGSIGSIETDGDAVSMSNNRYYDGGAQRYTTSDFASIYAQVNGSHVWYSAPSGTAGNAISFTQAMTLDASGNLGVGATSVNSRLQVTAAAGLSHARWTESATTVGFVGGAQGIITGHNGKFAVRGESGLVLSGTGNSADVVIASGGAATFSSSVTANGLFVNGTNLDFYVGQTFANTLNFGYNSNTVIGGWVNFSGYQGGTTQFRDFNIGNGKNGVVAFFNGSNGNVGIGTTSPTNLLHLAGASATPSLRLGSVSAGFHYDIGRENQTTGDFLINATVSGASQGTYFRLAQSTGAATFSSTIQTGAPTNGTAQPWKLGDARSGAISTDSYIIVSVNGTTYSIPALNGLP